ncbi:MAG: VPLPA-CTERM sorting domain-containing protein [Pseudomonadota bacterium]
MRILSYATAAILACVAPTQADVVFAYNSTTAPDGIEATATGLGVTASKLERGSMLDEQASLTFNSKNWLRNGDRDMAFINGSYLQWGFESSTGYDLGTLSFGYDSSHNGPKSIALDANIDGTWYRNIFAASGLSHVGGLALGLDLSSFTGVTSATFYLLGWDAKKAKGTFDLEDTLADGTAVSLTGAPVETADRFAVRRAPQVAAVPLPAGLPLMLGALAVFGVLRRRR